jgi:hypothetical protein
MFDLINKIVIFLITLGILFNIPRVYKDARVKGLVLSDLAIAYFAGLLGSAGIVREIFTTRESAWVTFGASMILLSGAYMLGLSHHKVFEEGKKAKVDLENKE